ncbi:hypothetical protein CGMCC3_g5299 [Colletotrichum fructicola]|nr:uncharacterized protein CGMCC3_g5299 [Colletotrichum fructicola]KAE9578942.1 hypothetical protein CGMCC3_g5299 [Colletotrichum fructicola]
MSFHATSIQPASGPDVLGTWAALDLGAISE